MKQKKYLEFSCFFYDPVDVGNLISGSSAFSKSNLYIWKFSVHVLLKPGLKDFEHNLASMWNECNCMIIWTFFGIAFLWDWNENWLFRVPWPLLRTCWECKFLGPTPEIRNCVWGPGIYALVSSLDDSDACENFKITVKMNQSYFYFQTSMYYLYTFL